MLSREKCSCGRTHVKMSKPRGRTDDMLIIRGVNVFPSQIETVLLNHSYSANYQIIVDRVKSTDTLDVQVEMTPEMFTDNLGEIERRQKELVDGLRSMLGLAAKVTLVAPKSIVRSEGKAVRVIDKRKILKGGRKHDKRRLSLLQTGSARTARPKGARRRVCGCAQGSGVRRGCADLCSAAVP